MTPQEVAAEINKLKPDLTDFWKEIANLGWNDTLTLSNNTALNLFKFELISILRLIHPRFYTHSNFHTAKINYLAKVNFTPTSLRHSTIRDILTDITSNQDLISTHVDNFKQYLNPYLYKKFGFVKSRQKATIKLEENEFSLELFKNALGKRKIPSTEGIEYFNQIRKFKSELCDKFMDVIFEHCPQPSTKFQRIIEESNLFLLLTNQTSLKYINLSRSRMRSIAYTPGIPISQYLFDSRDSDYVPFTCGVPRKPTPTIPEVASLISIMLLIANSEYKQKEYIMNCIKEHLQDPAYEAVYTQYKKDLTKYSNNLSNLLKDT